MEFDCTTEKDVAVDVMNVVVLFSSGYSLPFDPIRFGWRPTPFGPSRFDFIFGQLDEFNLLVLPILFDRFPEFNSTLGAAQFVL